MATSSYFRRELLPPARAFYERELGKLSRPDRKGWMCGPCPFHKSKSGKSFSVHVDGYFHCHGCGAKGGDLVKFMQLRYGYDFKTGAKILGAWREDLTREERMRLDERSAKIRFEQELAEQAEQAERNQRLRLRDEIHTVARIYFSHNELLSAPHMAAVACESRIETCWYVLALALDDLRDSESRYMQMIGLEYTG
jgi:hypothetical protein